MPVDDVRLWFGVISLIVIEVGLITPPVGLNVFIINSMAKDVPMLQTFRGVVPFLISDATRVGLVMLFPVISLYLPHAMR
jgi:TRAP-type C4-dicarboxylate transport system permease large subunit